MSAVEILTHRIAKGRAFVKDHPDDDRSARLLLQLEKEADDLALAAVAPVLARFGGRVIAIRDVDPKDTRTVWIETVRSKVRRS